MADEIFDKALNSTRRYRFDLRQRLTTGAVSVRSTAIAAAEVMLCAKGAQHVTVGGDGVTANAATNTFPMADGEKFHLQLPDGGYVAAIQDSAAGELTIIPVDGRRYF